MQKYNMPQRVSDEIFIAMSKALDFADPAQLSMTPVLTAMNRFMNRPTAASAGSWTATNRTGSVNQLRHTSRQREVK